MTAAIREQIHRLHHCRQASLEAIQRYVDWLQANQLGSPDTLRFLRETHHQAKTQELVIALLGESHRDKNALINALGLHGQKLGSGPAALLPETDSSPFCCPLELRSIPVQAQGLYLLPVETRIDPQPIQDLQEDLPLWSFHAAPEGPQAWTQLLHALGETVEVSRAQARDLGFLPAAKQAVDTQNETIWVPRWRYALLNLEDRSLRQGLRILNLPPASYLNAEPELPLQLLPAADVLLWTLSADQDPAEQEPAQWQRLCHAAPDSSRLAVINTHHYHKQGLEKQTAALGSLLGLAPEQVFATCARQSRLGEYRQHPDWVQASQIPALERFLAAVILSRHEKSDLHQRLLGVRSMLGTSLKVLSARHRNLEAQVQQHEQEELEGSFLSELKTRTQEDFRYYNRKLFTLRSSRRLMQSQGEVLAELVAPERFEKHVQETRQRLEKCWTTVSMNQAMGRFFQCIDQDLQALRREIGLAEKVLQSVYRRYEGEDEKQRLRGRKPGQEGNRDHSLRLPAAVNISHQLAQLKQLERRLQESGGSMANLFSGQSRVIDRFLNVLVSRARELYLEIHRRVKRWPGDALSPLVQATLEQKQMLQDQIQRLRQLAESAADQQARQQRYLEILSDLQEQIMLAEGIRQDLDAALSDATMKDLH